MAGGEIANLQQVLESNYLNDGNVTRDFEGACADLLGVPYAVAVTSGTAAIAVGLMAVGVGPGDEVIVPDLTFIATANAVRLAGGTPVLVDIDPARGTICPAAVSNAITARTRAVVPVHVSGRAAAMDEIGAITAEHGLTIVEDAAEAFASKVAGRNLGTIGDVGCFSFSPNKTITTGQGGLVVTSDARLFQRLRELKDQGRPEQGTGGPDDHPTIGYNFKLTNLQAAVGLAQLVALPTRLERMSRTRRIYQDRLSAVEELALLPFDLTAEVPQWTDATTTDRPGLLSHLQARGIGTREFWKPIHEQPPYSGSGPFPRSADLSRSGFWLPSAFSLTDDDVHRVCDAVYDHFGIQHLA